MPTNSGNSMSSIPVKGNLAVGPPPASATGLSESSGISISGTSGTSGTQSTAHVPVPVPVAGTHEVVHVVVVVVVVDDDSGVLDDGDVGVLVATDVGVPDDVDGVLELDEDESTGVTTALTGCEPLGVDASSARAAGARTRLPKTNKIVVLSARFTVFPRLLVSAAMER